MSTIRLCVLIICDFCSFCGFSFRSFINIFSFHSFIYSFNFFSFYIHIYLCICWFDSIVQSTSVSSNRAFNLNSITSSVGEATLLFSVLRGCWLLAASCCCCCCKYCSCCQYRCGCWCCCCYCCRPYPSRRHIHISIHTNREWIKRGHQCFLVTVHRLLSEYSQPSGIQLLFINTIHQSAVCACIVRIQIINTDPKEKNLLNFFLFSRNFDFCVWKKKIY